MRLLIIKCLLWSLPAEVIRRLSRLDVLSVRGASQIVQRLIACRKRNRWNWSKATPIIVRDKMFIDNELGSDCPTVNTNVLEDENCKC